MSYSSTPRREEAYTHESSVCCSKSTPLDEEVVQGNDREAA